MSRKISNRISSKKLNISQPDIYKKALDSIIQRNDKSFLLKKGKRKFFFTQNQQEYIYQTKPSETYKNMTQNRLLHTDSQKRMINQSLIIRCSRRRQPKNASMSRLYRMNTVQKEKMNDIQKQPSIKILNKILSKQQIGQNYLRDQYRIQQMQKIREHQRNIKNILRKHKIKFLKLPIFEKAQNFERNQKG